jgi:hypothetical protein
MYRTENIIMYALVKIFNKTYASYCFKKYRNTEKYVKNKKI